MSSNFPFDNVKDKSRVVQDSHPPSHTPSHEFTYAQATSGQNSNQSSSPAAPDINNLISSFLFQNQIFNKLSYNPCSYLKTIMLNLNWRLRLLKTFYNNNKYTHIKIKLLIYKSLIKPIVMLKNLISTKFLKYCTKETTYCATLCL
ncbi:Reverse transcriptase domain-containing protein [Aphis craccivora]|uniref:Reverse transcriptase domain-containing protein n=1 Tax=Aphis craccivora TaxID=307492 RepID=A0A6G0ZGD4_APHCR|nr:Reverse transcriptase domain-containing protein [Aphis craccivora]